MTNAIKQPSAAQLLIAEDNEANIAVLSEYLQAHGYQVDVARTGIEALDKIKTMQPDVIVMDIQLPGIDGLEVIRTVRAKEKISNVFIIALTALAMPGDRERCLAAGANAYLSKPVRLRKLVEQINKIRPDS